MGSKLVVRSIPSELSYIVQRRIEPPSDPGGGKKKRGRYDKRESKHRYFHEEYRDPGPVFGTYYNIQISGFCFDTIGQLKSRRDPGPCSERAWIVLTPPS